MPQARHMDRKPAALFSGLKQVRAVGQGPHSFRSLLSWPAVCTAGLSAPEGWGKMNAATVQSITANPAGNNLIYFTISDEK
jgi:hypothetical protein